MKWRVNSLTFRPVRRCCFRSSFLGAIRSSREEIFVSSSCVLNLKATILPTRHCLYSSWLYSNQMVKECVTSHHSITVSHHSITSQYHSITSQYHSITVSQYHSITVSQYHSITVSQYHSITVLQYHSITVSQYYITVSQYHIIVSQYHSIIVS